MTKKFQVHLQEDGVVVASFGELVVSINSGTMTPAHIDRVQGIIDATRRDSPNGKVLNLTKIQFNRMVSNKAARERLDSFMANNRDITSASGIVVSGTSMVSSAVRAAVTAIFLVARGTYPKKIFENSTDALGWIWQYSSNTWTAADRAECVQRIVQLEQDIARKSSAQVARSA